VKRLEQAPKMSYLRKKDLEYIRTAITLDQLVEKAVEVLDRMPKPVRWIAGPLTSGSRSPAENRERLHCAILRYKVRGVPTFNYLPFERRAKDILEWEAGRGANLSDGQSLKVQERLRDEFYAPIFASGLIGELRIMPGSYASLNVQWMRGYAKAKGMHIRMIPAESVPFAPKK